MIERFVHYTAKTIVAIIVAIFILGLCAPQLFGG